MPESPSPQKPLGRKSYGSIGHLPQSRLGPGDHKVTEGQARIATLKPRDRHDRIIVEEKLDGSNVGVARLADASLVALGRAGYLAQTSPYEQHQLFAQWVRQNESLFNFLEPGERICGEWLAQAHGTRYKLHHHPFVAFDIMRDDQRISREDFWKRLKQTQLPIPHVISDGPPFAIEDAMKVLASDGFHGAIDPVEGAVWRIERRGKFDFLCKYVRPDKIDGKYLPEISGQEPVWNWKF
jgi:RNA ligase-like protein